MRLTWKSMTAWWTPAKEELAIDDAIAKGMVHFECPGGRKRIFGSRLALGLVGLFLFLFVWEMISICVMQLKGISFPAPLETAGRLGDLLMGARLYDQTIYDHIFASLARWGIGYLLAAVLGIMIGLAMGMSSALHEVSMTPMTILQLIPGLAWIPIALLIFGLGETATIFMIFMTVLPTIAISTAAGIREVPAIYLKSARMMDTSSVSIFYRVLLPASSLQIINGLRIGLANGWRVLIAAEMVVGVALGLGYVLIQARWSLDFEAAFVSILIICAIGLFIEKVLFSVIEHRIRDRLGLEGQN
jgi:ABC-type nitrate/sulfonate/bicarbonate transport system permease component